MRNARAIAGAALLTAGMVLSAGLSTAQVLIHSESFEEAPGLSYTITGATGSFTTGTDYYDRFDLAAKPAGSVVSTTGADGSFVILMEDTNGGGGALPADGIHTLTLSPVDVTGYSSLLVRVALTANGAGGYDTAALSNGDYLKVNANVDGAGDTLVGQLTKIAPSGSNGRLAVDNDLDGLGDVEFGNPPGTYAGFVDYDFSIPAEGSSLVISLVTRFDAGDEELGIDNVRIYGVPAGGPLLTTDTGAFVPDFGVAVLGAPSASSSFTLSGDFLTNPVVVTAPANFEVSKDDATWGSVANYGISGGNVIGEPATVYVRFNPASLGFKQGALDVASTGAPGASFNLSGSGDSALSYAGLLVTEVVSVPTPDEFVEITNTTASPIDVSGVIVSDEDDSNTEGSLVFPAGTILAPGESVLVVANQTNAEPSWLDTLPAGTRVFNDADPSARPSTGWTIPPSVTVTAMEKPGTAAGLTSGFLTLSAADGAALHRPATTFAAGAVPIDFTLDGMNYNNADTGPIGPINADPGIFDTPFTRAVVGEAGIGTSYTRIDTALNTNSFERFTQHATTPGVFLSAGPDDPDAFAPLTVNFGSLVPPAAVELPVTVTNLGATQDLTVASATFTGAGAAAYSIVGPLPTPIGPGASADITVRFAPTMVGGFPAQLNVTTNDDSGDVRVIDLAGSGADAALLGVTITEIMFDPNSSEATTPPRTEWVEITNVNATPVTLTDWRLQDEDGETATFTITLAGFESAVLIPEDNDSAVTTEIADFQAAWGTGFQIVPLTGWGTPGLNNLANGPTDVNEVLTLRDGSGAIIDTANYQEGTNGWPGNSPGESFYVLPTFENNVLNDDGTNWGIAAVGVDGAIQNTVTPVFAGPDIGSPGVTSLTPTPTGIPGDATNTGLPLDVADVTAIYNHINGIELLTGQGLANADYDGNTVVDAADALAVIDLLVNP